MGKRTFLISLICLVGIIISNHSHAQDESDQREAAQSVWDTMGFGIGVSFTIDTGAEDRVKCASVVDGIVRVDDVENGIYRIVLEMHNFFWHHGRWGHGPFVAVQPGSDDLVNAVALGWMAGLRYSNDNKSFNLGVGISADPNVQVLGDGIKANRPLPGNETEIRYKEETQYGVIVMFSTSW